VTSDEAQAIRLSVWTARCQNGASAFAKASAATGNAVASTQLPINE
jgi:hypothetical protein